MDLIYDRTDKNGTKIYLDYNCPRCGGSGEKLYKKKHPVKGALSLFIVFVLLHFFFILIVYTLLNFHDVGCIIVNSLEFKV